MYWRPIWPVYWMLIQKPISKVLAEKIKKVCQGMTGEDSLANEAGLSQICLVI